MDLSTVKALVSFNQWFWMSVGGTILSFFGTVLYATIYQKTSDITESYLLGIILFVTNALDQFLAILNVRKGAIFDLGFYVSVLCPTIAIYTILILLVVVLVKLFKSGLSTEAGHKLVKLTIFLLVLVKITFSLAYSSPGGFIISAISFLVYIILLIIWPKYVAKKQRSQREHPRPHVEKVENDEHKEEHVENEKPKTD